jgi:16S rRNA C1402 (ribose-2'-O) methylase RsmI
MKGEIVLVIAEASKDDIRIPASLDELTSRIAQLEAEGHSSKAALKKAAKEFGLSKSEAYRHQLENKNNEI